MNRLDAPLPLLLLLLVWLLLTVASFYATSPTVAVLANTTQTIAAFLLPALIGRAAFIAARPPASRVVPAPAPLGLLSWLLMAVAYNLCVLVLLRVLEIPWRNFKFNDPVLSLGISAAQTYAVAALATAGVCVAVARASPAPSRTRSVCVAALAMVVFGSGIDAIVGTTPFVEWRP